ncbi:MAG: class I SAM-dependent methyltransferase [Promethearchaeota archaeon]|nr:MAG: class I SAM-dependent methyltransferase [Candidatus Lokiarchaeota archaeon]
MQLIENELNIDRFRLAFSKYTHKAFQILPRLRFPRILDIGCGSGIPTLELAKLSDGEIIGIDTNQPALDRLKIKIIEKGFEGRIQALNQSLFHIEFPPDSFDILWAEGVMGIIPFEKALSEWRVLLRTRGFLVVHDVCHDYQLKKQVISSSDYSLFAYFSLPPDAWWTLYYAPLESRLKELRAKYQDNIEVQDILQRHQNEVDMIKPNPQKFQTAFFIIQKE